MQTFFIPTDPEAFFADNPWLGQRYRAPQARQGLRFGPGCQSCAAPTTETVTLRGGLRRAGRPVAWEQVIHMCPGCAASTARRQLRQRALGAAALVLALVVAAAASLWARAAGWQAPWVLLSFLLGLTAWLPAQWAGRRWLMPAAPEGSHPVSLDYFLDPRLGPEGWIICLHLGHPEQARHFQRHNPHAITASDWDENYHHLGTGGAPPGALP